MNIIKTPGKQPGKLTRTARNNSRASRGIVRKENDELSKNEKNKRISEGRRSEKISNTNGTNNRRIGKKNFVGTRRRSMEKCVRNNTVSSKNSDDTILSKNSNSHDAFDESTISGSINNRNRKVLLKYKKQKCAYVFEDGRQCKNYAVGKSTLCKLHGGKTLIRENLSPALTSTEIDIREKFIPEKHPISYIDLSRAGMSDTEIAAEFQVSLRTMRTWVDKYEVFNTAYEIGKALHERWWIEKAKNGLRDPRFNTSLFKFMTMNKLGYSDKVEQKSLNMNVHGVLLVPDKMSEEEWENWDDAIEAETSEVQEE